MESIKHSVVSDTVHVELDGTDLYDATLNQIDTLRSGLIFSANDITHRVNCPHVSSFSVGSIGRLRLPTAGREFAFNAYPDQRLRRAPASDQPQERRWGWRIGERVFTVEAGVIPGRAGKVIRRNTQRLRLEVPKEFVDFCVRHKIAPDRVLSTFFADVCALSNSYICPREDGYTGSGDEGHRLALDYFNLTWGIDGKEARPSRRILKRGTAPEPDEKAALPRK